MKILAVQPDLVWENSAENLRHLEVLISDAGPCDLVVLPEMFATGFTMNPKKNAANYDGEELAWLRRISKGRAVCGSLSFEEKGNYYNRLFWVENGEIKGEYDKRHLFTHGAEQRHYTAGSEILHIHYAGLRILPFVCYDLRFPVWCRNTTGAELMIFVANWPQVRIQAWMKLLVARAIENQCYVLGVNRVGEDGNGVYHNGASTLVNPWGDIQYSAADKESATVLDLDFTALHEYRRQFPVLEDADRFTIL